MTQVPSTSTPTTRSRLGRAPWYAALAFLVACGGPVVPLGLEVSLGAASVAVVRGADAEVLVVLTRLGGAAGPVDLSVAGLPAHAAATFSPPTLDGAVLTSTLTIGAAAAASEAVTDLTVTASGGSLADDVVLSLEVTSLTVAGRIEGIFALPFAGAAVASQGASDVADASGAFTLTGLAVPYDLVVSAALPTGALHVYEGMTSASPLLRPAFAKLMIVVAGGDTSISGTVLGGAAIGTNEVVVVCAEGITTPVYGCDRAQATDIGYGFDAFWFEGLTASARIHALHFETDAAGVPVAYLGYDSIEIGLQDGLPNVADLSLEAVASASLTGSSSIPAPLTDTAVLGLLRIGANLTMMIDQMEDPPADFELLVPAIPGASYDVLVGGNGGPAGTSLTWRRAVGTDAGTFTVAEPVLSLIPAAGAVGVGLATPFVTTASVGARTLVWSPVAAGPTLALTTARSQVTMPDPALGGFVFPAGAAYRWTVYGHGTETVDEAASGGYYDAFTLQIIGGRLGGPGFDADGTVSLSGDRTFTFAP